MKVHQDRELDYAKRFIASDMAKAMRKLSEAFGADALILSSRKVANGVEVVGAPPEALEKINRSSKARAEAAERLRLEGEKKRERRVSTQGMRRRRRGLQGKDLQKEDLQKNEIRVEVKDRGTLEFSSSEDHLDQRFIQQSFKEVSLDKLYEKPQAVDMQAEIKNPLRRADISEALGDERVEGFDDDYASKFNDDFDWETEDDFSENIMEAKDELTAAPNSLDDFSTLSSGVSPGTSIGVPTTDVPTSGAPTTGAPTHSDFVQSVVASEQIQTLTRELAELKLQVQQRFSDSSASSNSSADSNSSSDIDLRLKARARITSEMGSFGLSQTIIDKIIDGVELNQDQIEDDQQNSVIALQAVKACLPVGSKNLLMQEGIVVITGGKRYDQQVTMVKVAVRIAAQKSAKDVAIISVGKTSEELRRLSLLTGIKILDCQVSDLQERILQCASYAHLLIDLNGSLLNTQSDLALLELRALNLGHMELIAVAADIDAQSVHEHIAVWRSNNTVGCIVNGIEAKNGFGGLISGLIETQLPVAAWIAQSLLPESVQYWSREKIMSRLVPLKKASDKSTIPIVC